MAIEYFTERGRGFSPKVSVRKQGQIGLNQGAVKRYKIEIWKCAILGYDRDKCMVALKLTNEEELPGATKITIRHNNGTIAAKGFLDFFDIPYKGKTRQYELKEDKDTGCLVFFVERKKESQQHTQSEETETDDR